MRFKTRILPCHPEDEVRRIPKKNAQGILRFAQNDKKFAFTLAEVLITLGIIGIIAAMTLPTVINNAQDKQFHAQWKKAYSVIANAYNLAYEDYPVYFEKIYGDEKTTAAKELYYNIFSRLNTFDYCVKEGLQGKVCTAYGQGLLISKVVSPGCDSLNKDKSKATTTGRYGCMYNGGGGVAYLTDGTIIYANAYMWNYPEFLVDVNGTKGPNVIGRDMYLILFRENRVIPAGAKGYEFKGCDKNIASQSGAQGADQLSGSGCGAKYLLE